MMKKILSLILTIAMISSLVVVGVSAEGADITLGVTVSNVTNPGQTPKMGDTIEASITFTAGNVSTISGLGAYVSYDTEKLTYVPETDPTKKGGACGVVASMTATANETTSGTITIAGFGAIVTLDANPVWKLNFTVNEMPDEATTTISIAEKEPNAFKDAANDGIATVVSGSANVSLAKSFTVTGVTDTAAAAGAALGDTEDDVKADLDALTFTVIGANDATAEVGAENWTCTTDGGYKDVPGDYTFEGTLKAENGVVAYDGAVNRIVTVTVTLDKIPMADEAITVEAVKDIEYKVGEGTKTDAEIIEENLADITALEVAKGNYKEDLAVAWAVKEGSATELDLTKVTEENPDNKVVIEGTITAAEADYFADGTKVIEVTAIVEKKATSSKPAAGIGNAIGGSAPATPPATEEPGTEEPGTEEPGTEEPGTEEPGTEEPGTEVPVETLPGIPDVAVDHWAADSIVKLKDAGIVGGDADGNFKPEDNTTRAEVAKMVANVLGLEATGEVAFADVTAEDWFAPFVAAAVEAGIVKGMNETEFAPNELISRQDLFAILGRALADKTVEVADLTFADADEIADYAVEPIKVLVALGMVDGYEDGTIRPNDLITRAEAAKVIALFMDLVAEDAAEEAPVEDVVAEEAPAEDAVVEEEAAEEVPAE